MNRFIVKVMQVVVAAFLAIPQVASAAADLMVYPSRVVLTDRLRSAQVEIINTSSTQATYQISMVRKRMTETGDFVEASNPLPGEKFADDLVKYSPRQVTLVPGASQTVRMLFKVPPVLEEGEYRSHLVFSKAPEAVTELPSNAEPPKGFSMTLTTNVAISIPVIARHGQLKSQVLIDPLSVTTASRGSSLQIGFRLSRSGDRSVYGDVAVFRGSEKLGELNGLAVYVPNDRRQVTVTVPRSTTLKSGDAIRIVFTDKEEKAAAAETIVKLP